MHSYQYLLVSIILSANHLHNHAAAEISVEKEQDVRYLAAAAKEWVGNDMFFCLFCIKC